MSLHFPKSMTVTYSFGTPQGELVSASKPTEGKIQTFIKKIFSDSASSKIKEWLTLDKATPRIATQARSGGRDPLRTLKSDLSRGRSVMFNGEKLTLENVERLTAGLSNETLDNLNTGIATYFMNLAAAFGLNIRTNDTTNPPEISFVHYPDRNISLVTFVAKNVSINVGAQTKSVVDLVTTVDLIAQNVKLHWEPHKT